MKRFLSRYLIMSLLFSGGVGGYHHLTRARDAAADRAVKMTYDQCREHASRAACKYLRRR